MEYRQNYVHDPTLMQDIFDSARYQGLRKSHVVIDGVRQSYRFFEDRREIALGLSTDGFCPFKRRKQSCWPIILFNYNLPPEIRVQLDNLLSVGVIPGPHSPKDMNSFLQIFVDELVDLARGVPTADVRGQELFMLRAHLLAIFGDIPAVSKILDFIGHNGLLPCRFCLIPAIRGATQNGSHLYCPLHRSNVVYTAHDLPLRNHLDCVTQGQEVLQAPSDAARQRLATKYGVKGVSVLARVPSVSIPKSFPIDFMHMVWLNIIPQLVDLWTNNFNGLDDEKEKYCVQPDVWNAISDSTASSGDTIPSQFGCRVPSFQKRSQFIAESWALWATELAPHLLRRRFRHDKYYVHFVALIKLLRTCLSLDISRDEIKKLREGLIKWVQDYEKQVKI